MSGVVARHQSRRRLAGRALLEVDVGERVAVGVADDVAVLDELFGRVIDGPGPPANGEAQPSDRAVSSTAAAPAATLPRLRGRAMSRF